MSKKSKLMLMALMLGLAIVPWNAALTSDERGPGRTASRDSNAGAAASERELTVMVFADAATLDVVKTAGGGPFYVGGTLEDPETHEPIGFFHSWGFFFKDGTLRVMNQEYDLTGRGKIVLAGVEGKGRSAITGGTGIFKNVRGQASGIDLSNSPFPVTFELIGAERSAALDPEDGRDRQDDSAFVEKNGGTCDNDGTCESGEDCLSCASDCPSWTASGAACGDGLCDAGDGEDCVSCPADCNGVQSGKPANRFCCGDGDGQNPVSCGDSRCTTEGFFCTTDPAPSGSYCCGDMFCEGPENGVNCEVDCGPPPCGDAFCDPGTEDQCSCAVDCGPPPGSEAGFCDDGIDNDCDESIDCNDDDCGSDPACPEEPTDECNGGTDTLICHHRNARKTEILCVGPEDNLEALAEHMEHGDNIVGDEVCDGIDNDCDGSTDEGTDQPTTCGVGACASTGVIVCVDGALQPDTCIAGSPSDETCNGIDDDCDGSTDEGTDQPTTCGVGACASTGVIVCVDGALQPDTCIAGSPSDETCNGIDDDCDGSTDEGTDQPTTCGVGACASTGVIVCVDGGLQPDTCIAGSPSDETCNGLDDNCDGSTDEGTDQATSCGTGACASTGVIACDGGVLQPDSCSAGDPVAETCNGLDDNCDGSTDEGTDQATSCGTGACASTGVIACDGGVLQPDSCSAGDPVAETCNGLDDNCDGSTDEGTDQATSCGTGACASTGVIACDGGVLQPDSCSAGDPVAETCNGLDDNCDGSTDEGTDQATSCGTGACASTGVIACDGGVLQPDSCSAGDPVAETCNGLDNNCDGSTDEGTDQATSCGTGACASTGVIACDGGVLQPDSCSAGDPVAETCNGLDDNCDGSTDEGTDQATSCGTGACASTGVIACDGGVLQPDSCSAGDPAAETCNGLDDNCDGSTDEGMDQATSCGTGACASTGVIACDGGVLQPDSCSAGDPVAETCNGLDDNCDGVVDNGGNALCDDANACTTDSCHSATGCVNANNTASCDDGSFCTTGDICSGGICSAGSGNPCGDDGTFCNGTESCSEVADTCVSSGDPCDPATETCDLATDMCEVTDLCAVATCNDNNACTNDSCNSATGDCVFTNNTAACNDGNACTTADACSAGTCVGGTATVCNDGNDCTTDSCNSTTGGCTSTPEAAGTACGDTFDSGCDLRDTCDGSGSCQDNDTTFDFCNTDENSCTKDWWRTNSLGECICSLDKIKDCGTTCNAYNCESRDGGCKCTRTTGECQLFDAGADPCETGSGL